MLARSPIALAPALACALLAQSRPESRPTDPRPKVLFYTQSAGFVHPVVRRARRGQLAIAEHFLQEMTNDLFQVESTQDPKRFEEAASTGFSGIAAIMFYTTGELPVDGKARRAFFDWLRAGGAFIGVHSATDTWYEVDEYNDLVGGQFDGHPWHEEVSVAVRTPGHPITYFLGGHPFSIVDEIYEFKNLRISKGNVLLHLDPDSVAIAKGKRKDGRHPIAWAQTFGNGRMFYCSLGHRPNVWKTPEYERLLRSGLVWTTRYGAASKDGWRQIRFAPDTKTTRTSIRKKGNSLIAQCSYNATDNSSLSFALDGIDRALFPGLRSPERLTNSLPASGTEPAREPVDQNFAGLTFEPGRRHIVFAAQRLSPTEVALSLVVDDWLLLDRAVRATDTAPREWTISVASGPAQEPRLVYATFDPMP